MLERKSDSMKQDSKKLLAVTTIVLITIFIVTTTISFIYSKSLDTATESNVFLFMVIISIIELFASLSLLFYIINQYKKDLLGFTPSELKMLYSEYKSLVEQLSEGVISVDKEFNISTLNEPFKKMFSLKEEHKGQNVLEVFPHINFKEIILGQKTTTNKLMEIFDEKILLSSFPLYLDGEVIGATAIVRSRLEVDMLLDQISGYRKISKALREQKHEFQNKLHVILGLIKMKDYDTVSNYITENIYTTNLTSDYYSSRIKDDKISALFVGKDIQSKEYDAVIRLSDDSNLTKTHKPISSDDLIIVIGNLIDNSLEAFQKNNVESRRIKVKINENDDHVLIGVSDNAGGIDPSVRNRMWKRGVSSKQGSSRGTGLSLINEIVKLYNGEKQVQSSKHNTYIEVTLKKVK